MRADYGATHSRFNPSRLYRDMYNGIVMGVCAGIADYFGINPWVVRLVAVIGLFLFTVPTIIAYFVAGFLLHKKPADTYESPQEEAFWRGVRTEPGRTAHDLRHKFRELERRLRAVEAHVTSREFQLRRDIDDLNAR